jgi:hypothetical protein
MDQPISFEPWKITDIYRDRDVIITTGVGSSITTGVGSSSIFDCKLIYLQPTTGFWQNEPKMGDFSRRVAVIVTQGGDPRPLAAKSATSTIPIVFTTSSDPLKLGLVTRWFGARCSDTRLA